MPDHERGHSLCERGGVISKGPTVVGTAHSVSIPLRCPKGSKVVGVSHTHPSGDLHLSEQDKKTARTKKLKVVCVKARERVRCYRFRHKS